MLTIAIKFERSECKSLKMRTKVLATILRTVLDLIEYLKPLMAIGLTIFSIFKSSPEFQKIIKNARA
jgi:hypothetical protein